MIRALKLTTISAVLILLIEVAMMAGGYPVQGAPAVAVGALSYAVLRMILWVVEK